MTTVSAARREWEDGNRRFEEEARDPARADALHAQHDAILEELRRRVGTTFTLAELAVRVRRLGALAARGGRGARRVEGMGANGQPGGRRCVPHLQPSGAGLHAVTSEPPAANRRRAPRRSRLWPRVLAVVVGAAVLFALGVALGLALDDRPVPGGTQTFVRTLEPLPQTAP